MARRRPRNYSPEQVKARKNEIAKRTRFEMLAKERERKHKVRDLLFILEYRHLCFKYKRYIGGPCAENNFVHVKTVEAVRQAFSEMTNLLDGQGAFRCYNRSEDHYPDVGEGWHV